MDTDTYSLEDYRDHLKKLDAAVCEAIAVSQATANRLELPAVGYSTHVFTGMCAHARAMICAAPRSRWTKREFETWDVSAVAAYARSVLEGYLLFGYLSLAPSDIDTQRTYVQVMHLYDCLKRVKILPRLLSSAEIKQFEHQSEEIKARLQSIPYFKTIDAKIQKDILSGKRMMVLPQEEVISALAISKDEFDFCWNYLSQYTHVLSFTFYRIEPNGRGTGLENAFDRGLLCVIFEFCTKILIDATNRLVALFPDASEVRKGMDSKFSPGPARNVPRQLKRERKRLGNW